MTAFDYILIALAVLTAPWSLYGLVYYVAVTVAGTHMICSAFSQAFLGGRRW